MEMLREAFAQMLQSASESVQFTDIGQHWAAESIVILTRLGAIAGYPDGTFQPNTPITRAEFASMIARLFAIDSEGSLTQTFTDIEQHWAEEQLMILASHGIIYGYSNGEFRPNETITREEAVVIMLRLLNMGALPQLEQVNFTDLDEASSYARTAISAMTSAEVISGYPDGTFQPKGQSTRAEVTLLLLRLLGLDAGLHELLMKSSED